MKYNFLKGSFAKKIIASFFGFGGVTLSSILFTILCSKLYGAEVLGSYVYIVTILTMFSIVARLGMDNSLIYFSKSDPGKYNIASIYILALSTCILIFIAYLSGVNGLLLYSLPMIFFLGVKEIYFSLYRIEGQIKKFYIIHILSFSLLNLVFLVLLGFFVDVDTIHVLSIFFISSFLLVIVLNFFNPIPFSSFKCDRSFIVYSLPTMFISFVGLLMNKIDIIMIEHYIGEKGVGVYQVIFQVSSLINIILNVFNIALAPKLAELFQDGRIAEVKRIYIRSTKIFLFISLLPLSIIFLFPDSILSFFGTDFEGEAQTLIIRAVGQYFSVMVGSVGFILTMMGHVNKQFFRLLLSALLNIVLNWALIPVYGLEGAALASALSILLSSILGFLLVTKLLSINLIFNKRY